MRWRSSELDYISRRIRIKPFVGWVVSIIGIYMLSKFLTRFVMKFDPYYIYLAAISVIVAVLISQKLELAVLIYAFLAPFILGASPGYTGTRSAYQPSVLPSEVGLVIIAIIWSATAIAKRKPLWTKCSLYLPFFAFLFVCGLSIMSSYVIWDFSIPESERRFMNQIAEVGLFALCGLAFWMGSTVIQRKEWINALYWPVLFVGIYSGILIITDAQPPIDLAKGGFMTAYSVTMTLALLLFTDCKGWRKRVLWVAFLFLLASVYINLDWISGWLTASIAMGILIGYKSRKAAFILSLIAFFVLFIYPGLYQHIYKESRAQGDMDRVVLWKDSLNMAAKVNPVLGIGPGDYMAYATKYASVWYGEDTYDTPHSNYAQVIAECGYLGLFAFVWMIWAGIRVGIRATRRVSSDLRWFTMASMAIFTGIAITSLVGDYLMPSRANGGLTTFGAGMFPWLLLGASVAAVKLSGEKAVEETEEEALQMTEVLQ